MNTAAASAFLALKDLPLRRVAWTAEGLDRHVDTSVRGPLVKRDQHDTGLCWLFAGLSHLEANFGLTDAVDVVALYKVHLQRRVRAIRALLREHRHDAHATHLLLEEGIEDGGTWTTFATLVDEVGVPVLGEERREWPRSSQKSSQMLSYLTRQLREGAALRDMDATLDACLGCGGVADRVWHPPTPLRTTTWQAVHAPDRPAKRWYVTPLGDRSYNVPTSAALVDAVRRMLESGRAVWASFYVDLCFDRQRGVAGGTPTGALPALPRRSKADRMRARSLRPNHAMLVVGVAVDGGGAPLRWRIHNSWGKRPKDAYSKEAVVDAKDPQTNIVATHEWFCEHVFHAVLDGAVCPPPSSRAPTSRVPIGDVLSTVAVPSAVGEEEE